MVPFPPITSSIDIYILLFPVVAAITETAPVVAAVADANGVGRQRGVVVGGSSRLRRSDCGYDMEMKTIWRCVMEAGSVVGWWWWELHRRDGVAKQTREHA